MIFSIFKNNNFQSRQRAWATRAKRYRIYQYFLNYDILKQFWKIVKGSTDLPMQSNVFAVTFRNYFDEVIGKLAEEPEIQNKFKTFIAYLNR